jgi:hypothetical protein
LEQLPTPFGDETGVACASRPTVRFRMLDRGSAHN